MSVAIGLALSGGGYRAVAFGLGAMRALHDRGLLETVQVVSGISGGSVLGALYAYGPPAFPDFEREVLQLLNHNLQLELLRRAITPTALVRNSSSALRAAVTGSLRRHNRTDALVAALTARGLDVPVTAVNRPGLATILSATDLASGNAVRFGSTVSSCSAYGTIVDPVPVADAVAASAAYPLLLPALVRRYRFQSRDGRQQHHDVAMTDGGVYDNLGLTPLQPGRSRQHTAQVHNLTHIIAVDAGRGSTLRRPARFLPARLVRSFDITWAKTQDAGRSRIHEDAAADRLRGFLYVYLGMRDQRLPIPVPDLVPRDAVLRYPTNFARIRPDALTQLTIRGEQLTRTLLDYYHSDLGT